MRNTSGKTRIADWSTGTFEEKTKRNDAGKGELAMAYRPVTQAHDYNPATTFPPKQKTKPMVEPAKLAVEVIVSANEEMMVKGKRATRTLANGEQIPPSSK